MARVVKPGPAGYENVSGEVAIVGVGESQHSAASGRSPYDMAFDAIDVAMWDAGLEPHEIDGIMVSKGFPGQVDPEIFRARYGVKQDIWFSDEGGAFVHAATAPYYAAQAFRAKQATNVISVFGVDWATQVKADTGGPASFHRDHAVKYNAEVVFGFIPQPVYFAHIARRYFMDFGATAESLGSIAVNLRRHANGHPGAVMHHKRLSMEDYLGRKPFIDPLRLEDCCLISDGAGAFAMTSAERAKDRRKRPVICTGVEYGGAEAGTYFAMEPRFTTTAQSFSAPGAFKMAGLTPADVDVLAVYDPFTITALLQIEDIGFCPKGEGGRYVLGDRLAFDRGRAKGGLPFNTHGGLLSHAYILGIGHTIEIVRQLRGEAANQVENCEVGVFGGYTGAECGTLVLRRGA